MEIPEKFTKWWSEHGQFVRAGGGQYEISFAFAAWNASRLETLEDAAKVCDECASSATDYMASEAAIAIRALATPTHGEPT
jgi:hypothetical protein